MLKYNCVKYQERDNLMQLHHQHLRLKWPIPTKNLTDMETHAVQIQAQTILQIVNQSMYPKHSKRAIRQKNVRKLLLLFHR